MMSAAQVMTRAVARPVATESWWSRVWSRASFTRDSGRALWPVPEPEILRVQINECLSD